MSPSPMPSSAFWTVYVQDGQHALAKSRTMPESWAVFQHYGPMGWCRLAADDHLTEAQARRKFSARSGVAVDPFMRLVRADYDAIAAQVVPARLEECFG